MSKFIEVTEIDTSTKFLLNIDSVCYIGFGGIYVGSPIIKLCVKETYEEIKELLEVE